MTKTEDFRVWNANEGYVRYNGAIQHIAVNEITIVPNENAENENEQKMFKIDCVIGGVAMELERKYLPCLYYNEDDCKNEKNAIKKGSWFTESHEQGIIYFWNSELMEVHSVYRHALVRELTFNGNNNRWEYKVIDNREFFDDADKCKYAQDIPVTEADSTTHINKGLRSRLALTDEQKELVAQYEEVCKKMKEANIGMMSIDDQTYAYNRAEVDSVTCSYDYRELCDDDYVNCGVSDFCTQVKGIVRTGGWDQEIFVSLPKKKEEE